VFLRLFRLAVAGAPASFPALVKKVLISAVLAGACGRPAVGCDLCSVYAATEAQGGSGKGFFGGLAEQYTYFNTLQIRGNDVANPGDQYLKSSVSQVFAGYNFNNRIGVQFNLPVIYRSYGYGLARGSEAGIGDASLIGNLRLYEKLTETFTFNWTALGGVKFPTGSASHLNPAEPDFSPGIGGHDLALGSGSYDGVVGTAFFARWRRLFLTGTMQYAARSGGEFGYQFADDWTWAGGPGVYLLLRDEQTLALQAVVSGESKGQDTVNGVATDDTAATSVFLGPQINYTWSSRLSAQVGVDLPASIVSSGEQLVPAYRVRAALTWRF
jgi:hypothetical protein